MLFVTIRTVIMCVFVLSLTVNIALANLVAWYTFDEGNSTMLIDHSGNGWNAPILAGGPGSTTGNTPYYEAGVNGGLAWNINDNAYAKPANQMLNAACKEAITVMFWAKGNSTMGSTFGNAFQAAGPWAGHYNTTQITWTAPGSGGNYTSWVTADFSADQIPLLLTDEYRFAWHHYAYVKDTATGYMAIYVDGDPIVEATGKFGTMSSVPDTYHVGIGGGVYGSSPMDGAIDDFRIYDRALTQSEIESGYIVGPSEPTAYNPYPADYDSNVNPSNVILTWHATDPTATHNVYFGATFEEVDTATTDSPPGIWKGTYAPEVNNYSPGALEGSGTYYWRIDEVLYSTAWKGNVWRFTTLPTKASNPSPVDGGLWRFDSDLSWTPGILAASHDIYFGDNYESVQNAVKLAGDMNGDGQVDLLDVSGMADQWQLDPSNLEPPSADLNDDGMVNLADLEQIALDWLDIGDGIYKGHQALSAFNYDPGILDVDSTYYWRIDEVGDTDLWKGDVWSFTTSSGIASPEYYVATDGSDNNPGTLAQPFKTIQKARDTLAGLILPDGGVTVYLRGGKYFLTSEIDFTSGDSGTAASPIVYCAYPGETPRLIGGVQLDPSWFTLVPGGDAVFTTRLPTSAQGSVYQCDLVAHGITNLGQLRVRGMSFGHVLLYQAGEVSHMELSFDGTMMKLAGWPNTGYSTVDAGSTNGLTFTYSGIPPTNESKWPNATDPWVSGFWNYDFYNQYLPVASVNTSTNTVTLDQAPGNPSVTAGKRWRAVNLLEELNQAGEYYIERTVGNTYYGKLYFWPPSSLSGKDIIVSTLGENRESLVMLNGASHVTFRGLTFEVGRFNAVGMNNCSYVVLDNCTVRNVGNIGVRIEGGDNCGVQNSKVYGLGYGIILSGGDRYALTASSHYARNNEIYNFGRWCRTYQSAVALYGVGNEATNNQIHDAPDHGILVFNNNHLVQYNKIYNVVQEASDSGAIYSYWGWDTRGSVIKFNCIYDITDALLPANAMTWGIYIDGFTSGTTLYGNILHKITSSYGGVFFQSGRDNVIDNCVITNSNRAITATEACIGRGVEMLNLVRPFNYQSPPWSTAYPTLAAIPNDDAQVAPYEHPGGSRIERSIGYGNSVWTYAVPDSYPSSPYDYFTMANNLTNSDPQYIDEPNRFLALKDTSPVYTIPGFTRIPFEKIGLLDQYKAINPIPRNGYTAVSRTTDLYWGQAFGVTRHNVYFGTNPASLPCVSTDQSDTSYDPGTMNAGTTYYWRIDEVDDSGTVTTGDLWQFTTGT